MSDICNKVRQEGQQMAGERGLLSAGSRSCNMQCLVSESGHSLICIRGTRGIGKTHQLMQFGKEMSDQEYKSTYVNLNNFHFSSHTIYQFAKDFYQEGGRILLLDQIFKYGNWSEELTRCRADFPELKIVFTASSVMTLEEDYPELKGDLKICDLYGFSFREYINWHHGLSLPVVTLEQILKQHREIAHEVCRQINPWEVLRKYLRGGYYPHQEPETLFAESLAKNMNMLLEVDLVYIRQIAPTYLPKLRKLLYLVSKQPDGITNVSSLSDMIETSRATVMNYLKYLSDARLIRMLYKEGGEYPKKPDRVYLNDTNILRVMNEGDPDPILEGKTMLLASLQDAGHEVHLAEEAGGDFLVNHSILARCMGKHSRRRSNSSGSLINILCEEREKPAAEDIPVWIFGLLY